MSDRISIPKLRSEARHAFTNVFTTLTSRELSALLDAVEAAHYVLRDAGHDPEGWAQLSRALARFDFGDAGTREEPSPDHGSLLAEATRYIGAYEAGREPPPLSEAWRKRLAGDTTNAKEEA